MSVFFSGKVMVEHTMELSAIISGLSANTTYEIQVDLTKKIHNFFFFTTCILFKHSFHMVYIVPSLLRVIIINDGRCYLGIFMRNLDCGDKNQDNFINH